MTPKNLLENKLAEGILQLTWNLLIKKEKFHPNFAILGAIFTNLNRNKRLTRTSFTQWNMKIDRLRYDDAEINSFFFRPTLAYFIACFIDFGHWHCKNVIKNISFSFSHCYYDDIDSINFVLFSVFVSVTTLTHQFSSACDWFHANILLVGLIVFFSLLMRTQFVPRSTAHSTHMHSYAILLLFPIRKTPPLRMANFDVVSFLD